MKQIYQTPRSRHAMRQERPRRKRHIGGVVLIGIVLLLVAGSGSAYVWAHQRNTAKTTTATVAAKKTTKQPAANAAATSTSPATTATQPAATKPAASTACASNTLSRLIVVSISQRHLWVCENANQVYDSAVVTGMENLPADLTPTGTYHIYAKETNLYLKGSDSTGSWNDYVNYWMPFLHNQYGSYGFHDATWRPADAFGNISPYSSNASHGCVELPLATAKWLYDWAQVGTTLTINS